MRLQTLYKTVAPWYRYIVAFHTDTEAEVAALDKLFRANNVRSVLDIPCGIGRHSVALARQGYDVTGVDYAAAQLHEARRDAKKAAVKVHFIQGDANTFSSTKKFDAAICMWSTIAEEPMVHEKVMRRVYTLLNKGGIFVIDNRDWSDIPNSGEAVISNRYKKDAITIVQKIHDRFTQNYRVRDVIYTVNGKKYYDLCVTKILTPGKVAQALKNAGFSKTRIIRHYKHKKTSTLIVGRK